VEDEREAQGLVSLPALAPKCHYTCDCHLTLPALDKSDLAPMPSVSEADAKYVDKMRDDSRGRED